MIFVLQNGPFNLRTLLLRHKWPIRYMTQQKLTYITNLNKLKLKPNTTNASPRFSKTQRTQGILKLIKKLISWNLVTLKTEILKSTHSNPLHMHTHSNVHLNSAVWCINNVLSFTATSATYDTLDCVSHIPFSFKSAFTRNRLAEQTNKMMVA